jgi:hypothetical protein
LAEEREQATGVVADIDFKPSTLRHEESFHTTRIITVLVHNFGKSVPDFLNNFFSILANITLIAKRTRR